MLTLKSNEIKEIRNSGDWTLRFPDTSFEKYNDEWNGNLEKWEAKGYPVIKYKTLKAKEIWNTIVKSAWASAEPGLWFRDRANKTSNSYYLENGEIICTNPCTTGDTLVSTENGYIQAKDLKVGMKIWTPNGLKPIEKLYNNGIQKIYRVEFSDGGFLECTLDHKLKVIRNKKYEWVAIKDLKTKDEVLVMPNEFFGNQEVLPKEVVSYAQKRSLNLPPHYDRNIGLLVGAIIGDGSFGKVKSRNSHGYYLRLSFGSQEIEWEEKINSILNNIGINHQSRVQSKEFGYKDGIAVIHQSRIVDSSMLASLMIRIGLEPNVKAPYKMIPQHIMNMDREVIAGVLDGLFSTDGNVNIKKDNPSLRFTTTSYNLAQQVRLMLLQFNIHGRIYTDYPKSHKYGDREIVSNGTRYNVVIMNDGIKSFYDKIGLSNPYKQTRLKEVAENWHFIGGSRKAKVISIQDTEREEEVFDLYEPETLTWITNGYVSFDCAEQGLPANACCNLGAINLSQFWDNEADIVNWDKLIKTTRIAVRFLDNVIDASHYHIKEIEMQQKGERRIGLGIMGLAELLIKARLKYGSKEGNRFTSFVMKTIRDVAYDESCRIAEEKGAFPYFNKDGYFKSLYSQALEEPTRQKIRETGIRNVTLLTVAPTGTTGTMIDTSTGIEPYFSWKFFRKGRLGIFEQNVPIAQQWLDAHEGQELPKYFVTAMDLTPEEHVLAQAEVQMWVDSSISKTVNCPNDWTVEQVSDLYMLMYNTGCKGGTIYRDGSRDEQVLNLTLDQAKEGNKKEPVKVEEVSENKLETKNNLASINLPKDNVELKHLPIQRTKRPSALGGKTLRGNTPYGTVFITINEDPTGYPYEVFINIGKSGSDLQAQGETLGRMYSVAMQMLPVENRLAALKELTEQIKGIGGARSIGFGANRVSSFSDAIATIITNEYLTPKQDDNYMWTYSAKDIEEGFQSWVESGYTTIPSNGANQVLKNEVKEVAVPNNDTIALASVQGGNTCPECQNLTLVKIEGCTKCVFCGYAEC